MTSNPEAFFYAELQQAFYAELLISFNVPILQLIYKLLESQFSFQSLQQVIHAQIFIPRQTGIRERGGG